MSKTPSGTVTFLFTDIEGSTKRWEQYPRQMRHALERHNSILRDAVSQHGGYVFKTIGDAFCASFSSPHDALQAAIKAQLDLHEEQWPQEIGEVGIRMALHTGVAELQEGDYFGQPLNRVARLLSAGHGGQVLLSDVTQGLVRDDLPGGVSLLDLGEHRLKDLFRPEHIYQLIAHDLPSGFPPLKTLDNRPNNLPMQLTPLIGREKEVRAVCNMLRQPDTRLVTMTGPGGTGKTRLGLQAAAEMVDDFADGVYFVNLAPITDHGLLISTIAQTLGVKESGGTPLFETLKSYLQGKDVLLLLDNLEQVVAAAPQVSDLLVNCPGLKVLVTSRIPLRVRGEHEYPVPPLGLPDAKHLSNAGANLVSVLSQYEAVRLFIERATSVKPDFEVTNENAPAVAEICARLDGLPLAIELAAARLRLLTPQAMLSRLENRLKLLTGGAQDLPARQQTLRSTIEWSYDLLDEAEKKLFRRLAVFVGGRTLEAIEAVCNGDGDLGIYVLDGVESLVSKSLLKQEEGVGGEPRFVMLETIHEYAREKLEESGEREVLEREHALYFMKWAESVEPELRGPQQVEWLDRVETEHDNLRAAMDWAQAAHEAEIGLRIAGALRWLWRTRAYWREGRQRLVQLLALPEAAERRAWRANALVLSGELSGFLWEPFGVRQPFFEESLALYTELDDKPGIAYSLGELGYHQMNQWNYDLAQHYFEQSLQLHRELGNRKGIARVLLFLGNLAYLQGDYVIARQTYNESLVLQQKLGNKTSIGTILLNLGEIERMAGNLDLALQQTKYGLAAKEAVGEQQGISLGRVNLGFITSQMSDRRTATGHFRAGLQIAYFLRDEEHSSLALIGFAHLALQDGDALRGARLLGAADRMIEGRDGLQWPTNRRDYEYAHTALRSQLTDNEWRQALQEGQAMTLEQAIAYALEDTAESSTG